MLLIRLRVLDMILNCMMPAYSCYIIIHSWFPPDEKSITYSLLIDLHDIFIRFYWFSILVKVLFEFFAHLSWKLKWALRNESNIFSVDRGINQKRTENCINARSALFQKFSAIFSVDTSINWKNIRFISYHLIFISFQQRNRSF